MPRKQPRTAGHARNDADNPYGFVGQRNMARLARLGQRHDKQPQIQADMFPSSLEDFALARAGEQKQTESKGFRAVAFLQRPPEPPSHVSREIALPLRVDFKGRDARARRLPDG